MKENEDCGVSISCLEDSYLIAEREYDKYNEIIAKLEQQLAEKDKRIAKLKDYIYSYNNEINNRPQVCNEYIDATCKDILEKMKELSI